MAQTLYPNDRLATLCGELRVVSRIGGGTQGDVYKVLYNGEVKALKWYTKDVFVNKEDFVRNLQRNIDARAPSASFLWPVDRTEVGADGCFGYVMDLAPEEYCSADDLFIEPKSFASYKRIVDACLNIAFAFGELHDRGYVYRDISGGNFFIDPATGKVLICDNDNVAAGNRDTGIRGTPRFMAPEVVVSNDNPTEACDRHSLSVILFYLMLMQHPLEGRRMGMLTGDAQRMLYGEQPLFVFDPDDDSNRPISTPDHPNYSLEIWEQLPRHMRDMFVRAFSQEALHSGSRRPDEEEWIRELTRLRSEIVTCPRCGVSQVFLENTQTGRCDNPSCGAHVRAPLYLTFPLQGYELPLVPDTRIYECQTKLVVNPAQSLEPLAWVLLSNSGSGQMGIQNVSRHAWRARIGNETFDVAPGATVLPRNEMDLVFDDETVHMHRPEGGKR